MILFALLIYFLFLFLVALGSAVVFTFLIFLLAKLFRHPLSGIKILLLLLVASVSSFTLVGGWFYGNHYGGLPWEKRVFMKDTEQYLNHKYSQFTYQLDEPKYACTGLFKANCSPHWTVRGKLTEDPKIEFLVIRERDYLEDTLGPEMLEQHFEKDRSKWEAIVRETMGEPHDRIAIKVSLVHSVFDRSTEPFQVEYGDYPLSIDMDIVKEMDADTAQDEAEKLFRLKRRLEEEGMSSHFHVAYLDPSVLEVIGTAQGIDSMSKETDHRPYQFISYLMSKKSTKNWKTSADALEALEKRPCEYCGKK